MEIYSTGVKQFHARPPAWEKMDKEIEYAVKAGEHLWTAIVTYLSSKQALRDNYENNQPLNMDSENLLQVHVGCFICEEPFEPKMLDRRCKGQPKGELRYVE